jgi:hypothetical protein
MYCSSILPVDSLLLCQRLISITFFSFKKKRTGLYPMIKGRTKQPLSQAQGPWTQGGPGFHPLLEASKIFYFSICGWWFIHTFVLSRYIFLITKDHFIHICVLSCLYSLFYPYGCMGDSSIFLSEVKRLTFQHVGDSSMFCPLISSIFYPIVNLCTFWPVDELSMCCP